MGAFAGEGRGRRDGKRFNEQMDALWIGMGTIEPDIFPAAIGAFRKMLDDAGIEYVYRKSPRHPPRMADLAPCPP